MNFEKNHLILMTNPVLLPTTLFFFLLTSTIISQHSDCIDALVYDSNKEGNISIPTGYGKEKEIFGHDLYNDYFFTEEHNTLWIYLYFRDSTEFEFELTPKKNDDDFDFMLYKIDRPNFCEYIKKHQPIPIRSNLARKHPKSGSITGMRAQNNNAHSKAGYEPYFSSTLKVNKGEEYYLIIDSPYGSDAYFNLFSETNFIDTAIVPKFSAKKSRVVSSVALKKEIKYAPKIKVQFRSSDSLHIPFEGLKVEGVSEKDSLTFFAKDSICFLASKKMQKYIFRVTASGFEPQDFIFYNSLLKDTSLTFVLKELELGAVLNFKNIKFISNKSTIMEESFNEIIKLYSFLIANEKIKIEVAGHVNGTGRNRFSYQRLSMKRAKSVFEELIEMGINKDRLKYKGYGNRKPLFVHPISNEQSSANRRVEIIVRELN